MFANWGTADCNSWDNGATVAVTVGAYGIPAPGSVTIYASNSYSYGAYVPITFSGTFQPINSNSAFEMRTTGSMAGYSKLFDATVNAPSIVNSAGQLYQSFRVNITYGGAAIGYADVGYASY